MDGSIYIKLFKHFLSIPGADTDSLIDGGESSLTQSRPQCNLIPDPLAAQVSTTTCTTDH